MLNGMLKTNNCGHQQTSHGIRILAESFFLSATVPMFERQIYRWVEMPLQNYALQYLESCNKN